ncbi:enoyl-CoA hydratase-related protein [Photobacterium sp. GJ3]|uniref:enoyl-CoA hydratase-related protein n=1 Tax=Photobacterium sp. GJ3 TaxID=2829502 RepID=UPI002013AF8D|nr:enoyl-CoA hydratase-related protein [Photobacterium sp. GJ3]
MTITMGRTEDELYAPIEWLHGGQPFSDIEYHKSSDGIARITIARPQVHNAFRPQTVQEMMQALADARYDADVGVIILTGLGEAAFCSGGDQKIRGITAVIRRIRHASSQCARFSAPDPYLPQTRDRCGGGWAVGGGHVLHMMCDLTIAAENAKFARPARKSAHSTVLGGVLHGSDRGSEKGP